MCHGRAACHHRLVQLCVVHSEGDQNERYSHGSGRSTASSRDTFLICCLHNVWVDGWLALGLRSPKEQTMQDQSKFDVGEYYS